MRMTGIEPEEDEAAPPAGSFQVLAIEIVVYSALVAAYLLLVLRSLRAPLLEVAEHHRVLYGIAAVLLMLGQGVFLEFLTSLLVGRFRRARREEAVRA
jgi:hypothetical protein